MREFLSTQPKTIFGSKFALCFKDNTKGTKECLKSIVERSRDIDILDTRKP